MCTHDSHMCLFLSVIYGCWEIKAEEPAAVDLVFAARAAA